MKHLNIKKGIAVAAVIVLVVSAAGCSALKIGSAEITEVASSAQAETSSQAETTVAPSAAAVPTASASAVESKEESAAARTFDEAKAGYSLDEFLTNMKAAAGNGKVFNSEYPVEQTVIEDVIAACGEPDKSEYIEDAKGTYDTYTNLQVVYAFNKGSQIFEVRSTDELLRAIPQSAVRSKFGTPDYTNSLEGQEILGYVVNDKYKLLFVFDTTSASNDPYMDHYSVFYPAGTVNSMAGDAGREW